MANATEFAREVAEDVFWNVDHRSKLSDIDLSKTLSQISLLRTQLDALADVVSIEVQSRKKGVDYHREPERNPLVGRMN